MDNSIGGWVIVVLVGVDTEIEFGVVRSIVKSFMLRNIVLAQQE